MNKRRKIILHIGAGKTGSSAIQSFLGLNVSALRREGIVVPDNDLGLTGPGWGNHVRVFRGWIADPATGRTALERAIGTIFKKEEDAEAVLLSAENLAGQGAAPSLFQTLMNDHDVEVILYIRRQDDFILSAWQQWNVKTHDDFLAWLLAGVDRLGNWKTYLQNWEKVVPREKITVRIFDRSLLEGGDVVADFFRLLNLSAPFEAFERPEKNANPSFNDAIVDLVKGDKRVFRDAHDNEFQNFVGEVTGDKYVKSSRESLLTTAQRRAILGRYGASNRWVQEIYFPERKDGLFPPIQDGYYFQPDARTKIQQQLGFVVRLVFGLHKTLGKRTGVR